MAKKNHEITHARNFAVALKFYYIIDQKEVRGIESAPKVVTPSRRDQLLNNLETKTVD